MTHTHCHPRQKNQDELLRFFGDFVHRPIGDIIQNGHQTTKQPILANIYESDALYEIHLAIPGYEKHDIAITFENQKLFVKSEIEETKSETKTHLSEWRKTSFVKSFNLPKDVDTTKITANYDAGVLKIMINKTEKAVPQNITIL
jgi:HSP20 family protein